MELLFAILIICLSAAGLAVGLLMGRPSPQTSCDGLACLAGARCEGCPHGAGKDER